jgi:hypothetical protein
MPPHSDVGCRHAAALCVAWPRVSVFLAAAVPGGKPFRTGTSANAAPRG